MPEKYNVYACIGAPDKAAIDVIDPDEDSVVYRIRDASVPFGVILSVSRRGDFIAALSPHMELGVFDGATFLALRSASTRADDIKLVSDPTRLLGITPDSTIVYDLPELEIDTVWNRGFRNILPLSLGREFLGFTPVWDSVEQKFMQGIVRMDAWSGAISDSFSFRSSLTPEGLFPYAATLSANEEHIFLIARAPEGVAVVAFDLPSHACIYKWPIETISGSLAVTTRGDELWVTQGFSVYYSPYPAHLGYILILDVESGIPKDTIRTLGMRLNDPTVPLALSSIQTHPTLDKAYVVARSSRPGMLVFNTVTRELDTVFYLESGNSIFDVGIAPR